MNYSKHQITTKSQIFFEKVIQKLNYDKHMSTLTKGTVTRLGVNKDKPKGWFKNSF